MTRVSLGRHGEDFAVAHLQASGLVVLERNWRCSAGEIDIVAFDGVRQTVVFCEVKTRSGLGFGDPLESITHAKLRRLRQLAAQWLADHDHNRAGIRIDAVAVVRSGDETTVRHLRGIG